MKENQHFLHSFSSRKQALAVMKILARVFPNLGGRDVFFIEKSFCEGDSWRMCWILYFDASKTLARKRENNSPEWMHDVASWMSGWVSGYLYASQKK